MDRPKQQPKSEARSQIEEIRARQAQWDRVMEEVNQHIESQTDWRRVRRNALLVIALVLTIYFIFLAFTDRTNFKEGAGILLHGAKQLLISIAVSLLIISTYRSASDENKKKWEKCIG